MSAALYRICLVQLAQMISLHRQIIGSQNWQGEVSSLRVKHALPNPFCQAALSWCHTPCRKRKRCENKPSVNPNIVCERLNGALTPWQRLPDRKMKDAVAARVPCWVSVAATAFLCGVFVALPANKRSTGRKWNGIELLTLFFYAVRRSDRG